MLKHSFFYKINSKKILAIILYLYYNYAGKGKVYVKEENKLKNHSK